MKLLRPHVLSPLLLLAILFLGSYFGQGNASATGRIPLAFLSARPLGREQRTLANQNAQWSSTLPVLSPTVGGRSSNIVAPRVRSSITSTTRTALALATSPEPIHTLFSVATFGPQSFWLLMILLPKADITRKIMGGFELVLLCCLVHFGIVVASIATEGSGATAQLAEFNNVFDPSGDPQNAFMKMVTFPNFVAEEWSHVLTWDLFVGRYIWLDGLKRGIFTSHSVLLSNLIGPPGLLLHWLTCLLVGKEPWEKVEGND